MTTRRDDHRLVQSRREYIRAVTNATPRIDYVSAADPSKISRPREQVKMCAE